MKKKVIELISMVCIIVNSIGIGFAVSMLTRKKWGSAI